MFSIADSPDNARPTLRGIDQRISEAEHAAAGCTSVERNRSVKLTGVQESVNRDLETKARGLAGIRGGHLTDHVDRPPEQVVASYHQHYQVEKQFRVSKSSLRARPICHYTRDWIDAHLTIVFTALAVSKLLEATAGRSIRKLVKLLRRYRTLQI